jgi:hypothetical protein
LPDKVKEVIIKELRSVRAIQTDYAKVIDSMEKHLDAYKKSKGTPAERQQNRINKYLNINYEKTI